MNTKRKSGVGLFAGCLGILILLIGGAVLLVSRIPPVSEQLPANAASLIVHLTSPTNASTIALNQTTPVLAEALGSAPIVRLELWIDGALVREENVSSGAAQTRASMTWAWMPADEGVHTLFARASDAESHVAQSNVVYVRVTQAETSMLVSTGEGTAPLPEGGFPNPESSQPSTSPTQEPSAPPPGDPPPSEPSLPNPIEFWIGKDFLKFLIPSQPPAAPNLWGKAQDCSVKLIFQDNSDNEDGFFIYRLAPGSLFFERIATLDAHASANLFAYLDNVWLGNWLYYATAFNTKGESPPSEMVQIHSGEFGPLCFPASGPQFTLGNAKLTPTEQVDKAYCYASINGGNWTRIPPSPNFLTPDSSGAFDMSPWFNTLPPGQVTLTLECWGWQGNTLIYLGEAQQTFGHDQSLGEIIGGKFKFTADILDGLPGWQFFSNAEDYLLGTPLGLELTTSPEKCTNHMPPLAAAFGGALLCAETIKDGYAVLTWEWSPLQSWDGSKQSIEEPDGYRVYRVRYPTPELVEEVEGGDMHVTMFPWPPAVFPVPNAPQVNNSNCYQVSAFAKIPGGVIESSPSNMVCLDILPPVVLKTVSLPASATLWRAAYRYEDCGGTYGTGGHYIAYPPASGIVVGHEHSQEHCDYWNYVYRGAVWFDLSSIQKPIHSATLLFSRDETYYTYYDMTPHAVSCATYLMLGTEDWRGDPYGEEAITIPGMDLKPLSTEDETVFAIEVTNIARAWRQGTLPNYGFVLRGPVEYIAGPVEINGDSEYQCMSVYNSFTLSITYFTEQTP